MTSINFRSTNWWMAYFSSGFAWKRTANIWKPTEYSQKQHLNLPEPFPENSLRFCYFRKFPEELAKFPEISLIFHGKAISLSFLECVGTPADCGRRYNIYVGDVRGIAAPSPAIYGVTMRSRWPTRIRKWQLCFDPIFQHLLSQPNK